MDSLLMKYFVLKPNGNDQYAAASRAAMRRYAKVIAVENPSMAIELHAWAEKEFGNAWCGDNATADRVANEQANEQQ